MDLSLIKTFLEVSETGSFAAASERLFVTQSAVSLRVHRLEDLLDQPLFVRTPSGVEATASGRDFLPHAQNLLRIWEKARSQIASPSGFSQMLTLGAQAALWPRLGFRFVDELRRVLPDLGIRAELGLADTLTRSMCEGGMQVSLTYQPTFHTGLRIDKVMEERLVLAAPWAGATLDQVKGRYVYVDWGSEFNAFHEMNLPGLNRSAVTLAVGSLSASYAIAQGVAAYLPARLVTAHLAQGTLHLVPDAPVFTRTIWSVWRDDLDDDLATVARKALLEASTLAAAETGAALYLL